jgi:hypothetical protein
MGADKNYFEFELHSNLYSYIGIEFENICLKYVPFLFKSTEIHIRKRYLIEKQENFRYIVPDVMISNLNNLTAEKLNIKYVKNLILDFKRSIYSISQKDINYLNQIPESKIIFCILQAEGKIDWRKKIDDLLNEQNFQKKEKNEIQSKIILWSAKNEFAGYLDDFNKNLFFGELHKFESLKSIKDVEKICEKLLINIQKRNEPSFTKKVLKFLKKYDSLLILKYLLILEEIIKLNYCTKDDVISVSNYSQPIIEDALYLFIENSIIEKKIFSDFLPHIYYPVFNAKPSLFTFFDITDQKEAKRGLELLINSEKIPQQLKNSTYNEFKNYFNIDNKYALGTIFRICSIFENSKLLTPEEVSSILSINQNNTAELLRLMGSKKILQSFKIEWENSVKCYSFDSQSNLPFKLTFKYLPELIRLSLYQIEETTELVIKDVSDLKCLFGKYWYSILSVYGILVKYKDLYKSGYSPDDLIQLLKKEKLNHSFTKARKMLAKLSDENYKLLVIERENIGTVVKIKHYILKNQNIELFNLEIKKTFIKSKQIENGIKFIKKTRNLSKSEIRSILKDGWTSKIRIYYILQSNKKNTQKGNMKISEALFILKNEGLNISKTNFIRYISPFSRTPLNLIHTIRSKRGENSPVEAIQII